MYSSMHLSVKQSLNRKPWPLILVLGCSRGSSLAGFKTHSFYKELKRNPVNRNRNPIWPLHLERSDWASIPVDRIPFKFLAKSMGFESGKGRAHESIPVSVSRARV